MKFILFFLILFVTGFSMIAQTPADYLLQKWIKVASGDPYNGTDISPIDTIKYKSTTQFLPNGSFFTIDNWNHKTGKWKWNDDSTKIGMYHTRINEDVIDDKPNSEVNMIIIKLTKDSLILGWQGPHGIVREIYVKTTN